MPKNNGLRAAYAHTFSGEAAKRVLEDLSALGMARQSTFHPEPLRMAFNEGRRSLALHIERMLSPEEPERLEQKRGESGRR